MHNNNNNNWYKGEISYCMCLYEKSFIKFNDKVIHMEFSYKEIEVDLDSDVSKKL